MQITLSAGVVCTWIVDLPTYEVTGDKILFEFFGLPYAEGGSLPLEYFINSIHPEDRGYVMEKIEEAISKRTHYEVEYRINEEMPRWVMASGKVNEEDNPTKFLGFLIDISQKKQSEAALRASEERFHFMTSIMPQQVWTAEANGMLDFVNGQACDYFGKSHDEVIGEGWQSVVHADDLASALVKWQQALDSGTTYETEFRLLNKDGEYRWHLARAVPYMQGDKVLKWFGTNTDIEEQKRINQRKDDFISIASHELKTPITSLKASLQLLKRIVDNPSSDMLKTLVNQANKSMDNISSLIDGLLNLGRIKEGELNLNKTLTNVSELLQQACAHVQTSDKHSFIVDCPEHLQVVADRTKISQVLINFVNNAVKYAPGSREINLWAQPDGPMLKIGVRDHGPGIAPDRLPRLFERYYRADDSGYVYSGLGLGLFINSEIIKKHDGQIGVISELGKGSNFWFTLPLTN